MLSFVTLIAYDFRYALKTIKSYYHIADEIVLGLDKDRISFSRLPFPFDDQEFFGAIEKLDVANKIKIIEQDFHLYDQPMDNDQYERRVLAMACKEDHWVIQIDADEFLLNPDEFCQWTKTVPNHFGMMGRWVTIFKQFGDDYLLIEEPDAFIAIGTKHRTNYIASRRADQEHLKSPLVILHQAWGRKREDLQHKLRNWAHSKDFDIERYLEFWENVNLENYKSFKNFHPMYPQYWPSLEKVRLTSIG